MPKHFDHENVALSAAVQMMADSKVAGVMFTVNIANGDDSCVMIEAPGAWANTWYRAPLHRIISSSIKLI